MSPLGNIIKKEVKELLTPGTLVPIILVAIIFASLGGAMGGVVEKASQKPTIAVVQMDGSGMLADVGFQGLNDSAKIVYHGNSTSAALSAVQNASGQGVIIIPGNFTSNILSNVSGYYEVQWVMYGTGLADSIQSSTVGSATSVMSQYISIALVNWKMTDNATIILHPTREIDSTIYRGQVMEGLSPMTLASFMSSQGIIVPLIVLMVVIYSGSMVITSMGTEKENKTLETLLTLPVRRSSIVFGKLAGATIVGLIMAIIYMAGMSFYMSSLTAGAAFDPAKYGMTLDLGKYLLVGISLFLALMCALALCMILGIFTKNYKAAQSMTMPITFLALIPMFVLMMTDFNTLPTAIQVVIFAIPFSEPMMAMKSLMFNDYGIVVAGIIYQAFFAGVAMLVAVKLFRKDILLTGKVKSADKKKSMLNLKWR
jgi:ABC-2 type transport system permease protein